MTLTQSEIVSALVCDALAARHGARPVSTLAADTTFTSRVHGAYARAIQAASVEPHAFTRNIQCTLARVHLHQCLAMARELDNRAR